MRQSQQNQHDGNRIDGVEHGNGNAENGVQPQIAHQEGKACDDEYPLAIGQLTKERGKYCEMELMSPTQVVRQAKVKIAASRTAPGVPKT